MKERVFIYCRVSTDTQVQRDSITDQLNALRRWSEEHDCTIIGEYTDAGFSGGKDYYTRPQFMKMLDDAEKLRPNMILFTKLDRFTRSPRDFYNVAYMMEKRGIIWKTIWEDFDTTTVVGKAAVGIAMVFADMERSTDSQRTKAHNIEKRKRGELVSGNLPRGYMIENKKPVKDPATRDAIDAFWRTYLDGKGLKCAMQAAYERGVHIRYVSTAANMLRNCMHYAGEIQGVPCEPYISVDEAQQILSTRKTSIRPVEGHTYLFRGIAVCGECGRRLGAHRQIRKSGGEYRYYNCTRHYATNFCSNSSTIIEDSIEQHLLEHLDSELKNLKANVNYEKSKDDSAIRIKKLNDKRTRVVNAYLDGVITREVMNEKILEIDNEISQIEMPKPKKDIVLPSDWRTMYDDLTIENKRAFWMRIIEKIECYADKSVTFTFR